MNRDAYRTPKEVFAVMNAEFNFKSDVCASVENALCHYYITEELNCLKQNWFTMCIDVGDYVWMNPPYSNIGPFVKRSAEMAAQGVGTVMLVMMDQSVGWYKDAIQTCQEVRLMIGGRLAFVDPSTNKPAAGNNKGSMFIIWHPFGRTKVQYSHIDRDEMLAAGRELINQSEQQHEMVEPEPTATTCDAPAEPIIAERKAIELITVEFTSEQLAEQIASGKLAFDGDHLALMLQLDGMFGKHDSYTTSQIRTAILALDEPGMVTKGGEEVTAVAQVDDTNVVELTEEQNDLFVHFDEAMAAEAEPVPEQEAEPLPEQKAEPAPVIITSKTGQVKSDDASVFFEQLQIPQNIRVIGEECEETHMWRSGHSIWGKGNFHPGKIDGIGIKTSGDFKKGYF
ncbi:phage N-6-adenine-methyltransferase, partial [Alishewanella sp. SMS9]|nr:phage N-6-adenine-methyltransferase [Alishewanella sp. SMS9]